MTNQEAAQMLCVAIGSVCYIITIAMTAKMALSHNADVSDTGYILTGCLAMIPLALIGWGIK